jgi:hypothetical protein
MSRHQSEAPRVVAIRLPIKIKNPFSKKCIYNVSPNNIWKEAKAT